MSLCKKWIKMLVDYKNAGECDFADYLQQKADEADIESATQTEVQVTIRGNDEELIRKAKQGLDTLAKELGGETELEFEVHDVLKLESFISPDNPEGYMFEMKIQSFPGYIFKVV